MSLTIFVFEELGAENWKFNEPIHFFAFALLALSPRKLTSNQQRFNGFLIGLVPLNEITQISNRFVL